MQDSMEPLTAEQFIARQQARWEGDRLTQRTIWMKDIGRAGRSGWVRDAWTFQIQHNYRVKVLVMERIRLVTKEGKQAYPWDAPVGAIEYRLGYYTLGANGQGKGRWLWGQFSPMIPQQDFAELLERAGADGTLLPYGGPV